MSERQVNETDEEVEVDYEISIVVTSGDGLPTEEEVERAILNNVPGIVSVGVSKY